MERETGFLFPNDFLILDEAHPVEQIASRQIGTVISQYLLRATVQRLYNARSKKDCLLSRAMQPVFDGGGNWSMRSTNF